MPIPINLIALGLNQIFGLVGYSLFCFVILVLVVVDVIDTWLVLFSFIYQMISEENYDEHHDLVFFLKK